MPYICTMYTNVCVQVSAGRTHSAAWTARPPAQRTPGVPSTLQLGTPQQVPAQYTALQDCGIEAIQARLKLLSHFSDIIYSSWRLLNLTPVQVGEGCDPDLATQPYPSTGRKGCDSELSYSTLPQYR